MPSDARNACRYCASILEVTGEMTVDQPAIPVGSCPSCGLKQLTQMSHAVDTRYSSDEYFPEDLAGFRERQARWNDNRARRVRELIPDAASRIALDFGCGSGGFLRSGAAVYRRLVGFDLSKRIVEAHRSDGFECVNTLEDVPPDISVIHLFHVLEHVAEPWSMLKELQDRWSNVQVFIIEVPNTSEALNCYYSQEAYKRKHHSRNHLWYFTSSTLSEVVERSGLKVELNSQLQRYPLANHLGWFAEGMGGGQDRWGMLNDEKLNERYEELLIQNGIADSLFVKAVRA